MPENAQLKNLVGLSTSALEGVALQLGEPKFRGKQMTVWLYQKVVSSFDEMTDLPVKFRALLSEQFCIRQLEVVKEDAAPDGTVKYLLQLRDGEQVESVYLPYDERVSLCISCQVGCPAGCTFCATAQGGLARNMTAGEIVDQILTVQSLHPERRISHIVFMGMGEPLLNYDEVIKAVQIISKEIGISARRITISTVGVVPGIERLTAENIPVTLALSLHAPDDEDRERLIPTARKWKLEQILEAWRNYSTTTGRNLTFEYLLIANVNDWPEQAAQTARLLEGLSGNVNLIPFNYVDTEHGFQRPSNDRIAAFRKMLEDRGRVTTQRMERGHAISAACGQLRRTSGLLRPPKNLIELTPVE